MKRHRHKPAFGIRDRGYRRLETANTLADRIAVGTGQMEDAAVAGLQQPLGSLEGTEKIGGRNTV
jgi:hypothetical protein